MGLFDKIKTVFKKENNKEIKLYSDALSKSRNDFVSKLINITNKYERINEDFFLELEEILIMADIGVNTVMSFMDRLRDRGRHDKISDPKLLKEVIVDELFIIYVNDSVISSKINYSNEGPTVVLFVGVNGVGKTTSIAKIASREIKAGKKVLLIGADTFRAGAVEQLKEWAGRLGCGFFGDVSRDDPASVVYDGLRLAIDDCYDMVFIDTAGRLQNKINLMKELEKINKVIKTYISSAPHETLLVIDATTGQNGISQAKTFKEVTDVSGIVLTKLDGTARGGIVLAIKEEVNIPVKFVGLGEGPDDLQSFDIENYIYGLFKDMIR